MRAETKVGILFLVSVVMVVAFAFAMGAIQPFSSAHKLYLYYSFAGGIEVGSPVRVMGIKVGRVKAIRFDPNLEWEHEKDVKLEIEISVSKEAWSSVREDSKFFINLAGVIGEKFIEISPGSRESAQLKPGAKIRGEDPPRIDQLISQSYGLAGKILEFVNNNEGSVVDIIDMTNRLVTNLNQTLKLIDKATKDQDSRRLLKNLVLISDDILFMTQQVRSKEGQESFHLLNDLLHRLEPLDAKAIKKFLQEEGIKARFF
ncbi:MAG: MCE family protein [Bdellovibrionales bacterium]|nr:MCE family protein [Bdellovibrionales bacterium]